MKVKLCYLFSFLAVFIFAISCVRPERKNTDTALDKFASDTKEYKLELAKRMQSIGTENLSYWFDHYSIKGDKEFIVINIKGDELCATGEIEVGDWSKISGMRRETSGYRGAELKGLKFETKTDSTGVNLVYKDIDKVTD